MEVLEIVGNVCDGDGASDAKVEAELAADTDAVTSVVYPSKRGSDGCSPVAALPRSTG